MLLFLLSRGKVKRQIIFPKLVEINDDVVDYFIDEDHFKIPIEELECYYPNSVESLQASLYPMSDYLQENIILTDFLTNEAEILL